MPTTLRPLDDVLPPADAVLARDWLLPTADELLERTPLLVLVNLLAPAVRDLVPEERSGVLAAEVLRAERHAQRPLAFLFEAERLLLEVARALAFLLEADRALAFLLEAERARALRERALDAERALERAATRERVLLDLFLAERDFAADDVVLLLAERLGLHTHTILRTKLHRPQPVFFCGTQQ